MMIMRLISRFLFLVFAVYIKRSVCSSDYPIDDTGGFGRRFDGIGGISGGGGTTKLLVNYPEPQRSRILDYLFLPNFAASLQILKVEIGGDAGDSDGSEASHMHDEWDENYQRGYEWWLMLQAKKRNPNIKLYGLPWSFPGWVAKGKKNPFLYPKLTAQYITNWVAGAKKYYNLTIDYIGIWNERPYDIVYVKTLRSFLNNAGFGSVQIVVADGAWNVANDVLKHEDFAQIVDIIGVHYPGTLTTLEALQTGKTLWASEDYSTFNNNVGGGCWARILNQNYVNGFMTSTISWDLIASYYTQLPFGRDGLMTAVQPWSGHYDVNSPIWVSAHTTQFVDIGWQYLRHGSGVGKLQYGGSYVSLVDPNHQHLTIIMETMSHNHSICIRPALPPYSVKPQNVTFQLKGSFAKIGMLYGWYTHFTKGKQSILFKKVTPIKVVGGRFTLYLMEDEVVTLTTQSRGSHGIYPDPPPSKPFPLPYRDNFDGYREFEEPYNLSPQAGAFEIRGSGDSSRGLIVKQTVLHEPVDWCVNKIPVALIGDPDKWSNVTAQADVRIPSVNSSLCAFIGVRVKSGGCYSDLSSGIFFFMYPSSVKGTFSISTDITQKKVLAEGPIDMAFDKWYTMTLMVMNSTAQIYLNKLVLTIALPSTVNTRGFVALGSHFGYAEFDNLYIR